MLRDAVVGVERCKVAREGGSGEESWREEYKPLGWLVGCSLACVRENENARGC